MLLEEVAAASADVAATSSRLKKVERLSSVTGATPSRGGPDRGRVPVRRAPARVDRHRMGVPPRGAAAGRARRRLELTEVDETFRRIGGLSGAGSQGGSPETRSRICSAGRRSREQRFLRGLLTGEIRQGALEGVMVDAVSRAADVPLAEVRRAAMLAGDLGAVAAAAIEGGSAALARFRLSLLTPGAADARPVRRGRVIRLRTDPAGRRRMEARRRPDPDPSPR